MSELEYDFDAELPDENGGAVVAPDPSAAAVASTESQRTVAALDAVLDGDDVDEDFRGKPVAEVLRVAKQHKHEAKIAATRNQEFNELQSQLEMSRGLLRVLQQQAPAPPRQPQVTDEDFYGSPTQAAAALAEERVRPLEAQIQALQYNSYQQAAESARVAARPAHIDKETYDALRGPLAAIMSAREYDPAGDGWALALKDYTEHLTKLAPRAAIPRAGAPPTGQARAGARPAAPVARLSDRDRRNLSAMAASFNIKPGTKAFETLEQQILAGETS